MSSSTYTGDDTHGIITSAVEPDDGTAIMAADVNPAIEASMDSLAAIKSGKFDLKVAAGQTAEIDCALALNGTTTVGAGQQFRMGIGASLVIPSAVGRTRPSQCSLDYDRSAWTIDNANFNTKGGVLTSTTTASTSILIGHFHGVPDGVTITGAGVWIKPAPSHISFPAFGVPNLSLVLIDVTTGAIVSAVGPTSDPSANVGDYEAHHQITVSSISWAFDASKHRLAFRFVSEGSLDGNGLTGLLFVGGTLYYAQTRLEL